MIARKAAKDLRGKPAKRPTDSEKILAQFERLDADARSAFLCIIAHDLTVAVRSIVYDSPVTQDAVECVKWINEALHHLTSGINPHYHWSAHDQAGLLAGIMEDSSRHGFSEWVDHAVSTAVGNTIEATKPVAGK